MHILRHKTSRNRGATLSTSVDLWRPLLTAFGQIFCKKFFIFAISLYFLHFLMQLEAHRNIFHANFIHSFYHPLVPTRTKPELQ